MLETLHFKVESECNRKRLDEYLFDKLHSLSRMYLRELVRTNRVQVNGEYENIGHRLRPNDFIEVDADLSRGTAMRPEDIPLEVVFEDDQIIVVNKPSGMLVHPTHREKSGTLLNALTYYLNRHRFNLDTSVSHLINGGPSSAPRIIRPGLVHRLDRETSGLLVVAKSVKSHRKLARSFHKKRVKKRYLALVEGTVIDRQGTIDAPIGRFAELKYWGVKADGKPSESTFEVINYLGDKTLLELEPITGRTNQLRIHCAAIGHPIVGDTERGGTDYRRLCLHARTLAFQHPDTREQLEFETHPLDGFAF